MLNKSKPVEDFHRNIADRVAAANKFVNEKNFKCEVVCDSMTNETMKLYDAHPERLFIIQDNRIVHIGGAGPFIFYDIADVSAWLHQRDFRQNSVEQ